MTADQKQKLEKIAYQLRYTGLQMADHAKSGHLGGAFSLSEILAVLYFDKMNIRPDAPQWEDRDRFVLSKGHGTVALYPALALRGYFPEERLKDFRKINRHLSGHAQMGETPGVDMSTGSLGQGLSAAVGMALAAKVNGKSYTTYAVIGDGECAEGQIWEAAAAAVHFQLDHLIVILDSNKLQLDGSVKDVFDTRDLGEKFKSFGMNVISIDGHKVEAIAEAIDTAKAQTGVPTLIVANTVKGKGVSFMENNFKYHGKLPQGEDMKTAYEEIRSKLEVYA